MWKKNKVFLKKLLHIFWMFHSKKIRPINIPWDRIRSSLSNIFHVNLQSCNQQTLFWEQVWIMFMSFRWINPQDFFWSSTIEFSWKFAPGILYGNNLLQLAPMIFSCSFLGAKKVRWWCKYWMKCCGRRGVKRWKTLVNVLLSFLPIHPYNHFRHFDRWCVCPNSLSHLLCRRLFSRLLKYHEEAWERNYAIN